MADSAPQAMRDTPARRSPVEATRESVYRGLLAVRDYSRYLVNDPGAVVTDLARCRIRYNLLTTWVALRSFFGAECERCTRRDAGRPFVPEYAMFARPAVFVDLFARRVSVDTADTANFRRYGWPALIQYGEAAPPPPPPPPAEIRIGPAGRITAHIFLVAGAGEAPPLGGEPGGLPTWTDDMQDWLAEAMRWERESIAADPGWAIVRLVSAAPPATPDAGGEASRWRPVWNGSEVAWKEFRVKVPRQAKLIRALLDAFEDKGWPLEVRLADIQLDGKNKGKRVSGLVNNDIRASSVNFFRFSRTDTGVRWDDHPDSGRG